MKRVGCLLLDGFLKALAKALEPCKPLEQKTATARTQTFVVDAHARYSFHCSAKLQIEQHTSIKKGLEMQGNRAAGARSNGMK